MTTATSQDINLTIPPGVRANDYRLPPMPVNGFRNYWYPAMFSRDLGKKPIAMTMLGEELLFVRADGTAYCIQGKCPHRGASLESGLCLAPGYLSCKYHGATFELSTGACVAFITEGPDSVTPQKLRAQTYPVEERHGLVWVFVGEGEAPPLDEDLPEEMLRAKAVVAGQFAKWKTNWRVALDNGIDVAHVPFLHRRHPHVRFERLPAFFKVRARREGKWVRVLLDDIGFQASFPGVGVWPRDMRMRWAVPPKWSGVRLPGILRIIYPPVPKVSWREAEGPWAYVVAKTRQIITSIISPVYSHIRWGIPVSENETRTFQCLVRHVDGLGAVWFRLYYALWARWWYHVSFQKQDQDVLETIDRLAPENLIQADAAVIQWRKLAAEEARQAGSTSR